MISSVGAFTKERLGWVTPTEITYAAEQGACATGSPQDRIYSQGRSGSSLWNNAAYSTYLNGFAIASAYGSVCADDTTPATFGIMTHEWIHTFGTPDLYDVGARQSRKLGGTGFFDSMSNPTGTNRDGMISSVGAFTKERLGWVTPTEITYDGVYTIRTSNQFPDLFKISQGYGDGEYLLIENRQALDYDATLPGQGLLILHVDNALRLQDTAGYPGQDGWPGNGKHYRVALLPADGNYDLEQGVNNGDAGDYWVAGKTLGPSNG